MLHTDVKTILIMTLLIITLIIITLLTMIVPITLNTCDSTNNDITYN
jgi:hypothetical protein